MMKRLINNRASRIINATVLTYYGIEINTNIDLAALDKSTVLSLKEMVTYVVKNRHADAEEWIVELLANCVIRFVMHVEPNISREIAPNEPNLMIWGNVVVALREYATKKYAEYMPDDALYPIIATEILMQLENLLFRHARTN